MPTPSRERFTITKRPSFEGFKLEEYKDEDNSDFFKVVSPSPSISKRVKTTEILVVAYNPYPIRLTIPVSANTQVREIRHQVSKHLENVNENNIKLTHRSRMLQDDNTIKEMNIVHHDVIDVIVTQEESQTRLAPAEILPKLTTIGYKTKPTMVELARMSIDELKRVKNFTIENEHGKIVFEGETNVLNLDIDKIVKINRGEATLYDDESEILKPKVGEGLNKPATFFLKNCKPKKETPAELFIERLKKLSENNGSEFISWDLQSNEWVFRIKHL